MWPGTRWWPDRSHHVEVSTKLDQNPELVNMRMAERMIEDLRCTLKAYGGLKKKPHLMWQEGDWKEKLMIYEAYKELKNMGDQVDMLSSSQSQDRTPMAKETAQVTPQGNRLMKWVIIGNNQAKESEEGSCVGKRPKVLPKETSQGDAQGLVDSI